MFLVTPRRSSNFAIFFKFPGSDMADFAADGADAFLQDGDAYLKSLALFKFSFGSFILLSTGVHGWMFFK